MKEDNLDSPSNVLREVEYESYQRRDTDSDKTGVYIVIDDPSLETPQVSHRGVDSSVAHEPHHKSMAEQLIQGDLSKPFSEWKRNVEHVR